MKKILLSTIIAYQRYLSPRKGFSCSYRISGGKEGCSGYGYRVIDRYGIRIGLALLSRRLDVCSKQYRLLNPPEKRQKKVPLAATRQAGFCDLSCDALDCASVCDGMEVISGAWEIVSDCGSCDSCGSCLWPFSKKRKEEDPLNFQPNSKRKRRK